MNFVCTCCGKKVSTDTKAPACDCGGLFELDFVPPAWDDSKIDRDTWSLFRYRAFMALEGDAWKEVTMGEGMSLVIPFSDDVLVKMDYMMPTLSFKDRGGGSARRSHEVDRGEEVRPGLVRQRWDRGRGVRGARRN